MPFLTGLLASIIRPIIQEQILGLQNWIKDEVMNKKIYEEHDKIKLTLVEGMAEASTKEERYAMLQNYKNYMSSGKP